MRYYVYISKSKVEMLYSQIPIKLIEKFATKLTIDLKYVKSEFSQITKEKELHSKLLIIEKYLSEDNLVGTIQKPKEYFSGVTAMRWGPLSSGLVYFSSKSDVVIGLGGSEKHIIGARGDSSAHSHSATPYLVAALNEQLDGTIAMHGDTKESIESETLCAVELATSQMIGLKQQMQFFAKTIIHYPSEDIEYNWSGRCGLPVILGTPIYVAIDK